VLPCWVPVNQLTGAPDKRAHFINYKNESWAEQHFKEFHELKGESDFHPYVVWRHKPYSRQTLNIDSDGVRVTPPISGLPATPATYFFGGPAMWGEGASDDTTIPASEGMRKEMTTPTSASGG
jgi:hypothetical protein